MLKHLITESGILPATGGLQVQRMEALVDLQTQVQQLQQAVAHKDAELATLAAMLSSATYARAPV